MSNRKTLLFMIIPVLLSCNRFNRSQKLSLSQQTAIPGETVIISTGTILKEKEKISVSFDKIAAAIVSAEDSLIEVLVPETGQTSSTITVMMGDKKIGTTQIGIKEHPTRKLILLYSHDGKVTQVGEKLCNDEIASPDYTAGDKIAYDLLDTSKQLLASGLIKDPMAMEVFDDPKQKIFREKAMHGEGTFTVNVPNIKTAMQLRLYTVRLPGDSLNEKFLRDKKLLAEIPIAPIK